MFRYPLRLSFKMLSPTKPGCRMGLQVIFGVRCLKPQDKKGTLKSDTFDPAKRAGEVVLDLYPWKTYYHSQCQGYRACGTYRRQPEHSPFLANALQCLTLNGSAAQDASAERQQVRRKTCVLSESLKKSTLVT